MEKAWQMTELIQMGKRAKKAAYELALLDSDTKNRALNAAADALEAQAGYILSENEKDMEAGRQNGMSAGLIDRLDGWGVLFSDGAGTPSGSQAS